MQSITEEDSVESYATSVTPFDQMVQQSAEEPDFSAVESLNSLFETISKRIVAFVSKAGSDVVC